MYGQCKDLLSVHLYLNFSSFRLRSAMGIRREILYLPVVPGYLKIKQKMFLNLTVNKKLKCFSSFFVM